MKDLTYMKLIIFLMQSLPVDFDASFLHYGSDESISLLLEVVLLTQL